MESVHVPIIKGNGAHRDHALRLKTPTKWHTGKRMDERRLSTSISNYWVVPFIRASLTQPSNHSGFVPARGWVFKQKAHRAIRFLLHQDPPSYARESQQGAHHCRMLFATPTFSNRIHARNCFFSFLSEKRESVSSPEGGVCANRTLPQSLMVTWDVEEKRYCSMPAPRCKCKASERSQGDCRKEKSTARTKDHSPLLHFQLLSTVLAANSCILASRKMYA